jgi:hypothetical protein
MAHDDSIIEIKSREYWFKIVEFSQQNWALIDQSDEGIVVWFFGDTSGVFDKLLFASISDAERALRRNGFRKYADDPEAHEHIARPEPPFRLRSHPNGPIYSSGRYWKK